jgi:hypothetical protein
MYLCMYRYVCMYKENIVFFRKIEIDEYSTVDYVGRRVLPMAKSHKLDGS